MLAIYLAPVAKAQDGDQNLFVLNFADQAPISDPVFPELSKVAAVESLTDGAWIVQNGHPIAQERADSLRDGRSNFPSCFSALAETLIRQPKAGRHFV